MIHNILRAYDKHYKLCTKITCTDSLPFLPIAVCGCIFMMKTFSYEIFQELKNQLGDLKDNNETTAMDLIHADNVRQGRDKYKTLKVS